MNRARCIDSSEMNKPMMMDNYQNTYSTGMCDPIYEPMVERCCHRQIIHEVPHIMPCNTRIINHHIYRHTYTPYYTCCEENEISNVYDNKCCM